MHKYTPPSKNQPDASRFPLHDHQAWLSAARAILASKFVFATFGCFFNYRRVLRLIRLLFALYGTQSSSGSPPLPSAFALGPGHPLHVAELPVSQTFAALFVSFFLSF